MKYTNIKKLLIKFMGGGLINFPTRFLRWIKIDGDSDNSDDGSDDGSDGGNVTSDNIVPAIIYILQDEVTEELTVHSIEESLADSVAEDLQTTNYKFKIMGYKQPPEECTISETFNVE